MSDEMTNTAPETEEVEEQVSQPETEEASDTDELLEKFKKLDPEVLKNIENMDEFYKRVNRKSVEAAELRKQAEAILATAQTPKGADTDDEVELDDKAQAVLRKFLQRELAPLVSTVVEDRKEIGRAHV